MSRILRRPMFRGGGTVSSYGNGIATGLVPKRGLVDGPGGYAGYPPTVGMGPNMTGSSYGKGFSMFRPPALTAGVPATIPSPLPQMGPNPFIGPPGGGVPATTRFYPPTVIDKPSMFNRAMNYANKIPGAKYIKKIPGISKVIPGVAAASPYGAAAAAGLGIGSLADFYLKSTDTPFAYAERKNILREDPFTYDETNLDVEQAFKRIEDAQEIGEAPGFLPRGGPAKFYKDRNIDPATGKVIPPVATEDPNDKPKGNGNGDGKRIVEPVKSDKEVIQEYMDMFKENLGGDKEDLKRSRYLELAKFGANLLGQPGGQSLGEAVGKASAPALEGLTKLGATERAGDRQAKALGFQAALRELESGSIGKAIKDLKKVGFSDEESKEIATRTGTATSERTKETRIQEFSKILETSGVGNAKISRSLAEKIEQSGRGMSGFESKEDAIKTGIIEEEQFYYDKKGKTYKGKKVGDEIKLIEVQFTKSK